MSFYLRKGIYFFLFFTLVTTAFADDKKIEGRFFNIYYQERINPFEIAQRLEFSSSYLLSSLQSFGDSPEKFLPHLVDMLFLEVSDIMDIHLYHFKGNIRIFSDFQSLDSEFYKFYKLNLQSPSFYIYETNTIYISLDNLRVGILGHEIAHAIMNNYFVVPPPTKLQEVIAGYVEYTLQKKSK